jgi:GDP-4-dehydro-6-deoxy-D-mannose reductase
LTRHILVTGATGFVGTHLVQALDRPDNRIFGTSFPQEPGSHGLACESDFCRLDLRQGPGVSALVEAARPDWVFHLAAVSNVRHSWERRGETLETNLLGTQNLLEAIRTHAPGARVLFASSSNVYADMPFSGQGLKETDEVRPISPYALSKICGEMLCRFYTDVEGLDIVISRAFPHTGPGQSRDFVCSDWARQIVQIENGTHESEIRVGNIDVFRDFCDVRDVVLAYERLLETGKTGEAYNVSSGTAVALRLVLEQLLSLSGSSVEVRVDPEKLRKTDILRLQGDNRKLHEASGWEPAIPLERTLADLLDHWREALQAGNRG